MGNEELPAAEKRDGETFFRIAAYAGKVVIQVGDEAALPSVDEVTNNIIPMLIRAIVVASTLQQEKTPTIIVPGATDAPSTQE